MELGRNTMPWKLFAILSIIILVMGACTSGSSAYKAIVKQENGQWIYVIENKGKTIIKQETMPGTQGIQFFPSREVASQTATLVKNKLMRGQMPSITEEEMDYILNKKKEKP